MHTILHKTDHIIFPLILQTIVIAPMMSIWGKGLKPDSIVSASLVQLPQTVFRQIYTMSPTLMHSQMARVYFLTAHIDDYCITLLGTAQSSILQIQF